MSWAPCPDPTPGDRASADAIETLIIPRAVDLGEMVVRRALPSVKRQMVGPFIFFDQMGPAEFLTDQGIDVRPHPHINLATVTYLFEGQILHRDSLGTEKTIEPGAVNWMRAGRGIVHSERTSEDRKRMGQRLFGIQSWMAMPEAQEESDPAFVHHGAQELPVFEGDGVRGRVITGEVLGARSPLLTPSETVYAHLDLRAGARTPVEPSFEERAVYTLKGEIEITGDTFGPGQLLVLRPGDQIVVTATSDAEFMLFGGAPMAGLATSGGTSFRPVSSVSSRRRRNGLRAASTRSRVTPRTSSRCRRRTISRVERRAASSILEGAATRLSPVRLLEQNA